MADLFEPLRQHATPETRLAPPEEIRRRGDRLRRRRTALRTTVAAVSVAAVATGGVLVADSLGDDRPTTGPATTSPATSPATSPTDAPTASTTAPQPSPSSTPPGETVSRIPRSFDLAVGIEELGSDGDLTGPSREVQPLGGLRICGAQGFALPPTATDHLGLVAAMPQFVRTRDLTLHPDPDTATAAGRALVAAFEECPTHTTPQGDTTMTEVASSSLGTRSWVVTQTFESADLGPVIGQEIVHVVLAEQALLVTWTSSEGPGALDAEWFAKSVEEDSAALRPVLAAVCDLADADCG